MSAVRLLYSDGRVPLSPTTSELLLVVPACEDMSRYCRLVRYCRAGGSDDDRPLLLRSMYCSAVSADMLDGNEPVKRLPIRCRPLFTQSNIPYAGSEKRISERACVKVPTDASGARLSAAQGRNRPPTQRKCDPSTSRHYTNRQVQQLYQFVVRAWLTTALCKAPGHSGHTSSARRKREHDSAINRTCCGTRPVAKGVAGARSTYSSFDRPDMLSGIEPEMPAVVRSISLKHAPRRHSGQHQWAAHLQFEYFQLLTNPRQTPAPDTGSHESQPKPLSCKCLRD